MGQLKSFAIFGCDQEARAASFDDDFGDWSEALDACFSDWSESSPAEVADEDDRVLGGQRLDPFEGFLAMRQTGQTLLVDDRDALVAANIAVKAEKRPYTDHDEADGRAMRRRISNAPKQRGKQ